jgi:hypothetical protein
LFTLFYIEKKMDNKKRLAVVIVFKPNSPAPQASRSDYNNNSIHSHSASLQEAIAKERYILGGLVRVSIVCSSTSWLFTMNDGELTAHYVLFFILG